MSSRDSQLLFEQYRLAVEMADRVSSRRLSTNRQFAFTVMAMTTVSASAIVRSNSWFFLISLATIAACLMWRTVILEYAKLNTGKFAVIQELEQSLPARLFSDEERYYKKVGYKGLSKREAIFPVLFGSLHVATILVVAYSKWLA